MFEWDRLVETGRKTAALDVAAGSDTELLDAARALERMRALLDATEAHVLAELHTRATCEREHGLRTGVWLAREARLAVGGARQRVRVAVKIRRFLPLVDAALIAGTISWDHAKVLADACNPRIAAELAELQEPLIAAAKGTVFDRWKAEVAGIVERLDQDGGHDPADDEARNTLTVTRTLDGLHHLRGLLVGDGAVIAAHAIDTMADELAQRFRADHDTTGDIPIPTRATLRALAFVELCRRALTANPDTRAPRPEVTLVVNASDPTQAHTPDGVRVQDDTTRLLTCDAIWRAVIIDRLGVPLDMARSVRFATAAQRRAVAVRDGGCVFPGCDAPIAWVDYHHVVHHEHGGPTDTTNLAAGCRTHHRVWHRPGWTMHTTPDGWFWWQTPTGHTFWSQRHHRQRAGPAPPPR